MRAPNPDPDPSTSDHPSPSRVPPPDRIRGLREDPSSPPPPPSTFQGQLQLADFMYQPGDTSALRRSPRHAVPATSSSAVTTTTSSSSAAAAAAACSPVKRARSRSPASSPKTPPPKTTTTTKKKKRKRRAATGYAPPSTYAHLPPLPDALRPGLLVLFVGLNPGLRAARTGHAYAHPTNAFWRLLHASGATPAPCAAADDARLPARFRLGLTNEVARPSRSGAELSRAETDAGVAALEAKVRENRPEAVCLVGKGIWDSVWRVRHGGRAAPAAFRYGWQAEGENMGVVRGEWEGARVFVASSTSGLAATLSPAQKLEIWSELGAWVKMRRAEEEVAAEREAAEREAAEREAAASA